MGFAQRGPPSCNSRSCFRSLRCFGLSPRYGIHNARKAHDWFLKMMREHEEFEVKTDRAGEWPMPFWDETVGRVVVE